MFTYIPQLTVTLAILACLYSAYSDIKMGIIPNRLTLPLIAIGITLNAIYSIIIGDLWYLVGCLILTGFIFVIGYIFWKMGAWAGGDVKLFTALAALIPFYLPLVNFNLWGVEFPLLPLYPFPFTLIINSLLSILPFLLVYVLYIAFKSKPHLISELISPFKEYKSNFLVALSILSAGTIAFFFLQILSYYNLLLFVIIVLILSLLINKIPLKIRIAVVSILTVITIYQSFLAGVDSLWLTLTGIPLLWLVIMVFDLFKILLFSVNQQALQDDYPLDELEEGMIAAHPLYAHGDEVYYDDKTLTEKMREAIKRGDISILRPRGKVLVDTMAAGLTPEHIKLLKELHKEGKIGNSFRIKKGLPFAPSILIGLIISLFIGDLAFILQQVIRFIWS